VGGERAGAVERTFKRYERIMRWDPTKRRWKADRLLIGTKTITRENGVYKGTQLTVKNRQGYWFAASHDGYVSRGLERKFYTEGRELTVQTTGGVPNLGSVASALEKIRGMGFSTARVDVNGYIFSSSGARITHDSLGRKLAKAFYDVQRVITRADETTVAVSIYDETGTILNVVAYAQVINLAENGTLDFTDENSARDTANSLAQRIRQLGSISLSITSKDEVFKFISSGALVTHDDKGRKLATPHYDVQRIITRDDGSTVGFSIYDGAGGVLNDIDYNDTINLAKTGALNFSNENKAKKTAGDLAQRIRQLGTKSVSITSKDGTFRFVSQGALITHDDEKRELAKPFYDVTRIVTRDDGTSVGVSIYDDAGRMLDDTSYARVINLAKRAGLSFTSENSAKKSAGTLAQRIRQLGSRAVSITSKDGTFRFMSQGAARTHDDENRELAKPFYDVTRIVTRDDGTTVGVSIYDDTGAFVNSADYDEIIHLARTGALDFSSENRAKKTAGDLAKRIRKLGASSVNITSVDGKYKFVSQGGLVKRDNENRELATPFYDVTRIVTRDDGTTVGVSIYDDTGAMLNNADYNTIINLAKTGTLDFPNENRAKKTAGDQMEFSDLFPKAHL